VWKQRVRNSTVGYITFPDGEVPPPSALAGRRVYGEDVEMEKPRGRLGKGIISVLYSKFDHNIPRDTGGHPGQPVGNARRKTVMYDAREMGISPLAEEQPGMPLILGQYSMDYLSKDPIR